MLYGTIFHTPLPPLALLGGLQPTQALFTRAFLRDLISLQLIFSVTKEFFSHLACFDFCV